MAYLIEAGHDENGKYSGGKKGDQKGDECLVRNYYNYPWDCYLEPIDNTLGERIVDNAIKGANNNNIGYSQSDRNSAYQEYLKVKDISKIGLCNTDCSAFTSLVLYASGVDILTGRENAPTTHILKNILLDTNKFKLANTPKRNGTILLNEQNHVAIYSNRNNLSVETIINILEKGEDMTFLFRTKEDGKVYIYDNHTIKYVENWDELAGLAKINGLDNPRNLPIVECSKQAPYHIRFLNLAKRNPITKF